MLLYLRFIIRFPFQCDRHFYLACAVADVAGSEGAPVMVVRVAKAALPAATGAGEATGVPRFCPRPVGIRLDFQYMLHVAHFYSPFFFKIMLVLLTPSDTPVPGSPAAGG